MNVDTDTQFAYLTGVREFILKKQDYLTKQVGNPEGADKPNKKVRPSSASTQEFVADSSTSTTILVSGFGKERRPSLSASRRPALILATSTVCE